MSADERYEAWKQQRNEAEVPADFADRVMARLPAQRGPWDRLQSALGSPP